MAQGKKSFIAYVDWKDTFDALPDEKAGQLIKFIYAYVNDENPKTDDVLINAVFANIRNTLKRDLKKWDKQHQQRVKAGKRSAEVRKRNATSVNGRSVSSTVSVSVSDSVNVSVNDNDTINSKLKFTKHTFKKELLSLGVDKEKLEDWCKARDKKKLVYTKTALDNFLNECEKNNFSPAEAVKIAAGNGWGGFKAQWVLNNQTGNKKPLTLAEKMRQDHGISN